MLQHTTIVDVLRNQTVEYGSRPIYTWLNENGEELETWSFADLSNRAQAIAKQLQERDLSDERVLLLYPPGLGFIAAFFGCLYAGVVAVPANLPRRNRTDNRLRSILADSQPGLLLSTSQFASKKEAYVRYNPELEALDWLASDQFVPASAEQWSPAQVKGTDIAYLQYTSGSTADPKGVIVTHHNLLADHAILINDLDTDSECVCVVWLPLFHDLGLAHVIGALYAGCRSIHMDPITFLRKPFRWLEAMSRYRCTHTSAPNFAYDLCVRSTSPEERRKLDLSCLSTAVNTSEPVRVKTMERFVAAFKPCGFRWEGFAPAYGLAEATAFVRGAKAPDRPVLQSVSSSALAIGKVVPLSPEAGEVRTFAACGAAGREKGILIVDPETLVECEPVQIGEIWVEGPHISPGYWNRTEETMTTLQARLADTGEGPFLRTGDLGFILANQLYITGRIKDLIIVRGRNYFPQDIELVVENSHPSLQEAAGAAFGIECASEEVLIVAQEVRREARRALDMRRITAAVRQAVAEEHGIALDGLLLVKPGGIPRTTSGKIRRLATKEAFLNGTLRVLDQWLSDRLESGEETAYEEVAAYSKPFRLSKDRGRNTSQIRSWILWQIGRLTDQTDGDLNLKRPFTDFGLDSLVSVQLVHELAEWVGQPLELSKLWELSNIEGLIDYLASILEQQAQTSLDGAGTIGSVEFTEEETQRVLDSMDDMSEAEVDELLRALDSEEPPSGK